MRSLLVTAICCSLIIFAGCQEEIAPQQQESEKEAKVTTTAQDLEASTAEEQKPEEPAEQEQPRPPIFEDFQGEPQLSLFPRVGDFRPEEGNDRLPYWNTFIEHLVKVTGLAEEQATSNRSWVFRSIDSIDSLGYFSPFGVEPASSYRVSFKVSTELAQGASAGVGVLEFNEFLWISDQYTEDAYKQHFRGTHEGKRLTGTTQGEHTFTFTTGPETRMIHLILYREGKHDRNVVSFDNIRIAKVSNKQ